MATDLDILDRVAQIVHEVREREYQRADDGALPPVYSWLGIQDESERPSYDIAAAVIDHILPDLWDDAYTDGRIESDRPLREGTPNPYRARAAS